MPKSSSSSRAGAALPARPGVERLVEDLLRERASGPVGRELSAWLGASPRFRAWVERYRDKIRRKLRAAVDRDALRDVRTELAVAARLVEDRRLEVDYEPYGSGRAGPDFTVRDGSAEAIALEVTRPRPRAGAVDVGRAVLAKLRQLQPGVPNVVLLAVDGAPAGDRDVGAEMRALRHAADTRDLELLARAGVASPRGFYDRYLRLGGVLVWSDDPAPGAWLWTNRSARIPLPTRLAAAVVAALGQGQGDAA